ncbi:MAG: Hint domain-containing protein [Candidatus Peribacteraceae bacterium]|nr:Hint domain-containing protein [Candidatus Peribacteraceae bacterium]
MGEDTSIGENNWVWPDSAKTENNVGAEAWVAYNDSLSENTIIYTQNGSKKIKNITIGEFVYSLNIATNKIELNKVSDVAHRSITSSGGKWYNIYFNGGSIKATGNHGFYSGNQIIQAKDLKVGDILQSFDGQVCTITEIVIEENSVDYVWNISVNNSHNFYANGVLTHNAGVYDYRIRIMKGGVIGATDKSSPDAWPTGSFAYVTHGSETELWGETWTADDINASNFGIAVSAEGSGYNPFNYISTYLTATNFGFTIPAGAAINGIKAEIKKKNGQEIELYAYVDHIRMTVTYTVTAAAPDLSTWALLLLLPACVYVLERKGLLQLDAVFVSK